MSTAATRQNWEGRVVDGKFPLRRWLGGSQQSDVFLTDLSRDTRKQAAIKLIPTENKQAHSILSSWQLGVKLDHPHLLKIFDTGLADIAGIPQLYVVTEYAEENLGQILPERSLTPEETKEMILPLLDALEYLHNAGLVHGQLKPSNVLVVDNQLKLSSDSIRKTGEANGTVQRGPFDAPEVGEGKISAAADIWSLGGVLVTAMTQTAPPAGVTEHAIPESMPEPFATIAKGCLKANPSERLGIEAIRNKLQPTQASPTIATPSIAKSVDTEPRERKFSWGTWAGVAVIVVLAIVGVVRYSSHSASAPQAPEATSSAQSESPAPEPTQPAANSSPGIVKGSVLSRVPPDISSSARRTIHGKIKVNVRLGVDSLGKVENAKLESAGPSRYFAERALEAARQWKFKPAQKDGEAVASKWVLHFRFTRSGTEVDPAEVAP
jgi:TonB family protein